MAGKHDVNLNITATAETGPATAEAGRDIDKVQRKVDGFNTKRPTAEVTRFTSAFTKSAKDGESAMQTLQRAIDDSEARIAKIRKDFNQPGGNGVQLFGDLRTEENNLRSLQNAFKSFSVDIGKDGAAAGDAFTRSAAKSAASDAASGLFSPVGLAVAGAVSVAATPVIISALTAAFTAGVGGGIIAAGALIEKNNPVLVAGFDRLSDDLKATLQTAASPLVGSFEDALATIEADVSKNATKLKALFSSVAPAVDLIAKGVDTFVADSLPGLTAIGNEFSAALTNPAVVNSLKSADRAVDELLLTIGNNPQVIAVGFETLGKSVEFAADAFNALDVASGKAIQGFDATTGALKKSGIGGSNDPFAIKFPWDHDDSIQTGTGLFANLGAAISSAALKASTVGPNFGVLGADIAKFGTAAQAAATQGAQNLLNQLLGLDQADLNVNESLTNLTSTLKTNHDAISLHTKAGQADRQAILDVVSANIANFETAVNSGVGADKATAAYDANEKALRKQLTAAGLTTKQIDDLIGKYDKVPDSVKTTVSADTSPAEKALATFSETVKKLPDGKTFTIRVALNEDAQAANLLGRATGQHIAFGAGDYLDSGFAFPPGSRGGPSGNVQWTMPPAQIDVNVGRTLVQVDGQTIAQAVGRATAATRSHQRHAARVGRL